MHDLLKSTILASADPATGRALTEGYEVLAEGRLGRFLGTAAIGMGMGAGMANASEPENCSDLDLNTITMDADDGIECGLDGCWVDDETGRHRVDSIYDDCIRERRGIAGLPTTFDDERPEGNTQETGEILDEGRVGRAIGGALLGLGMMTGLGHAAPKGDSMACLASPQYAKNHASYCNTLKPSPKKTVKADVKKTAKQAPGKTIKGKHGTMKVANMKNVWQSDAFQDHVQELYDSMIRANPAADSQMTYEKAGQQALQDVATGKLKL